jgi:hypothetical protein
MYQQLWGYKVEEKLYLGVREQKRLNTTGLMKSQEFFQMSVTKFVVSRIFSPNTCNISKIGMAFLAYTT